MQWYTAQIKFPEPVQIRAISAAAAAAAAVAAGPGTAGGTALLRAFAKDVFSPSAARFVQLLEPPPGKRGVELGQQLQGLPLREVGSL
jgi:hypothetical protein